MSSTLGRGWTSRRTLWFSGFKSTQIHTAPDFFGATTMPAHQGVGTSTFEITPIVSIRSSSSMTFPLSGSGTQRGVKSENGVASDFSLISYASLTSIQPPQTAAAWLTFLCMRGQFHTDPLSLAMASWRGHKEPYWGC